MRHTPLKPHDCEGDYVLEIARIFAAGVLRLHQRGELPLRPNGLSFETALHSAFQDLENSRETRLSVTRG